MKLDALRIFQENLNYEFSKRLIDVKIYYFHDESWRNLLGDDLCSPEISSNLELSEVEDVCLRNSKNCNAWFYMKIPAAVVHLVFPRLPRKGKMVEIRAEIEKIYVIATNAYKVSYNSLTQLLSREEFRDRLEKKIKESKNLPKDSGAEAQESSFARSLAVVALDIDHFKQVNDTWGHLYGDQVLRAFAQRLENCAKKIIQTEDGDIEILLAHPSGEEFVILILANALREQFFSWADEFRKEISDSLMPSEIEWAMLSKDGGTGSLIPPPLKERAVTASLGLAMYDNSLALTAQGDSAPDLLDRADTALYRAKAAGRNQVIAFENILNNCGRVIEHDSQTKIVAIDIGANVGVTVGQEFRVFLPTFSGNTVFLLNDGRTKRSIGKYPRVESARIVVFNTQPEISFAIVPEMKDSAIILEVGSHLEAIPAGSIGHLLPSASKYFPANPSSSDQKGVEYLQNFVKNESELGNPFAVVVRFTNESEYLKNYGSVALNAALAHLYREARISFEKSNAIEVLDRGAICIVGSEDSYARPAIDLFVNKTSSELPGLNVVAGVFSVDEIVISEKEGENNLNPAHAIEFAQFAASDAGRNHEKRIRFFGYQTANEVLDALRASRSYETGYVDFLRLQKLGVESAILLNQGGLLLRGMGKNEEALELYAAAIVKNQDQIIYKGNYGVVLYDVRNIDAALKVFNALSDKELTDLLHIHEYAYFVYARLLANAKLKNSDLYNARFETVGKNALALKKYISSPARNIIVEAMMKK